MMISACQKHCDYQTDPESMGEREGARLLERCIVECV